MRTMEEGAGELALFVDRVREATGIDNGYRRCGGIELLHDAGSAAEEEWRGHGIRLELLG